MISFRGGINLKDYSTAAISGLKSKIYGVSWSGGSSPALTRTDDAAGMVANAGVDAGVVTNDFDAAEIYRDITTATDSAGNVFVFIPAFYIHKTAVGAARTWQISRASHGADWYLPKCFLSSAGAVLPGVYIGKYVGSLAGGKLESKTNTYPLINATIVQFRTYAQANGAGYQQLDVHVVDVLQTLFYVEFATLHSQSIMAGFTTGQYSASHTATVAESGVTRIIVANATAALYEAGQAISVGTSTGGNQIFYGRTITSKAAYDASNTAINFDGTAVNIAIGNTLYNTGWRNGFSSGIAASSGSLVSNSTGKHACMYRGVENPWGNVWQWVDGININEYQAWLCADAANYASNLFTAPYEQLGYVDHNADGYVTVMGFDAAHPFAAFPTAVGGGTATYYADYYYRATGQRVAAVGGYWGDGSLAGLSCWDLVFSSAGASVGIGGRLCSKVLG